MPHYSLKHTQNNLNQADLNFSLTDTNQTTNKTIPNGGTKKNEHI